MAIKIDLFLPTFSQYHVLQHFSEQLTDSFKRLGIEARLLKLDNPQEFIKNVQAHAPDYTLSFNELEPDSKGRFLCDLLKIPHINVIVDRPDHYFMSCHSSYDTLIHSKLSILTFPDRIACKLLKELGHQKTYFLPHGVEKTLHGDTCSERPYPVSMLCSLIDYQTLRAEWKSKYPRHIQQAMENALNQKNIPYYYAFAEAMNISEMADIVRYGAPLNELEIYLRGKDRIALLQSITSSPVHVFGASSLTASWETYLKHQPNITVHNPVSYPEALNIMKQTKILLNSSPTIYEGGHERIFTGMACGTVVVTKENSYLKESFEDNKSILYTSPITDLVIKNLLDDELKLRKIATSGQKIAHKHHTWDTRAETLIEHLKQLR